MTEDDFLSPMEIFLCWLSFRRHHSINSLFDCSTAFLLASQHLTWTICSDLLLLLVISLCCCSNTKETICYDHLGTFQWHQWHLSHVFLRSTVAFCLFLRMFAQWNSLQSFSWIPFFLFGWQMNLQLFSLLHNSFNQHPRELSSVDSRRAFSTELDDWIFGSPTSSLLFYLFAWKQLHLQTQWNGHKIKNDFWWLVLNGRMNPLNLHDDQTEQRCIWIASEWITYFCLSEFNNKFFSLKWFYWWKMKIKIEFFIFLLNRNVFFSSFFFDSLSLFTIPLCFHSEWKIGEFQGRYREIGITIQGFFWGWKMRENVLIIR